MTDRHELISIVFDNNDAARAYTNTRTECYPVGKIGLSTDRIEAHADGIIMLYDNGSLLKPNLIGRFDPYDYTLVVVTYAEGRKKNQKKLLPKYWEKFITPSKNFLLKGLKITDELYLIPMNKENDIAFIEHIKAGGDDLPVKVTSNKPVLTFKSNTCVDRGEDVPGVVICKSTILADLPDYKRVDNRAVFENGFFIYLATEPV